MAPKLKQYPIGVTPIEKSPLFHLVEDPWMLLPHMLRQFTVTDLIFKHVKKDVDLRILDIGCGYAEQFILATRREFRSQRKIQYTGIDLDEGKREQVLKVYPKIDYRIADITKKWSGDFTPNVCVMSDTLEHVTKEQGVSILKQAKGILNGIFVLSVPTPSRSEHRKNEHHQHEWEMEELVQTATKVGYKIVDSFYLHVPVNKWKNDEVKSRIPNAISSQAMGVISGKPGSTIMMVLTTKE